MQSGRTRRNGLQQACPASSFRCPSDVHSSEFGEHSLFPLHTVVHICRKSDYIFGLACYWGSDVVLLSGIFAPEGVAGLDLSTAFTPTAVAGGVARVGGRGWSGYSVAVLVGGAAMSRYMVCWPRFGFAGLLDVLCSREPEGVF